MNPFRPNPPDDFSESDLIAFHLHELSLGRERALRRAIQTDAALAAESEAVAASLAALKDVPMQVDDTVLERNWNAVRPALVAYVRPVVRVRRWRLPVFAGAAMACAATLAFFVVPRHEAPLTERKAGPSQTQATPKPLPAPAPDAVVGGKEESSAEPLFKANLHTGLFHPRADRPGPPVSPLTLAQVPAAPPPAPHLTTRPAPVEPVVASSSTTDEARPFGEVPVQPDGLRQEQPRGSKKGKLAGIVKARREHTLDVMLGIGGNFIAPQPGQSATKAIVALGALHQQFRPALGYRITASYSRPDFGYNVPGYSSSAGTVRINSRIYEVAGTYVVEGPHHGRFKASIDAGAGLLAFLPTSAYESTSSSIFRVAGIGGVNVDVAVTQHWGARMSYRAQVFRGPNFVYTDVGLPVTSAVTVSNEPSVGITYRFGKKK